MVNSVSNIQNITFGQKEPKPKNIKNKGTSQALIAAGSVNALSMLANKKQINMLCSASDLNHQDTKIIKDAVSQIIKEKGLDKKGVEIINVAQRNFTKNDFISTKVLSDTIKEAQKNNIDLETAFSKIKLVAQENKRAFIKAYNDYMKTGDIIVNTSEKIKNYINSKLLEINLNLKSGTISKSKKMQKFLNRFRVASHINEVEKGRSAFVIGKKLYLPAEKLGASHVHELGHILTNFSKCGKFIKSVRCIGYLAPLVSIAAIFGNTKEEKDTEKLSPIQKVMNFTRKNAFKLMFFSSLPLLADEALASINGAKAAKKILTPELYKKVITANKISFAGYLLTAVISSLAVFTAVKVKDFYHKKHEAKVKAFNETLNKN